MPKHIGHDIFYSVPEAAKRIGVSRMTMLRWVTRGIKLDGIKVIVLRDPISNRYYIAEESVRKLAERFEAL